jgi:hypothetical protein
MKKYIAMINVPAVIGFGVGYYIGRKYDVRLTISKGDK